MVNIVGHTINETSTLETLESDNMGANYIPTHDIKLELLNIGYNIYIGLKVVGY